MVIMHLLQIVTLAAAASTDATMSLFAVTPDGTYLPNIMMLLPLPPIPKERESR
jgi:hypothetical protein